MYPLRGFKICFPSVEMTLAHIFTLTGNVLRGMVKNMPLLRRAGNNGRPWVHAVMCDNIYSDICMIIHAL